MQQEPPYYAFMVSAVMSNHSHSKHSVINLNGQLLSGPQIAEKAKVSVYDRSYLYGDSLYEVARSYHGKFYELEGHLVRLEHSALLCHMILNQKREDYFKEIYRTFEAWKKLDGNSNQEAYCRLIVSRGEGTIGFGLNNLTTQTLFTIIVQRLEPPTAEQFQIGYHLQVSKRLRNDPRALDPAMKSGNYLNSLLAYLEAASQQYDDALLCNHEGHLTEGTTFNIFYIKRGIVVTPPLEIGILDGITRRKTIEHAHELGLQVREVRFPKERLYEADEVFMSSSIKEVFPVTRVDGKKMSGGVPGKLTIALSRAFKKDTLHL